MLPSINAVSSLSLCLPLILLTCYCPEVISGGKDLLVERSFVINYESNCFMKDNKPFRYISGGMHYFRIPSIYWQDRLQKAKALGVNTIQTYVAWNIHEINQGVYDFTGDNDLLKFIEIAEELGLLVILRPGPYIDAEWEYGGFPWWLAKNSTLKMRTSDPGFMYFVENWFDKLFPLLEPKIYKNGGPIIAFQVENEYGSYYACDETYLRLLKGIYDKHFGNHSIVLFTVDGYTDHELQCGTSPDLYVTVDFGSDTAPDEAFKQQRKYQKSGPLINSEYYTGWLDFWGRSHQKRNADVIARQLDTILSLGASVNLYMLHGGTNFRFMNGVDWTTEELANPQICPTSYDYDAPISEAGDTTFKYFKIRDVLKKYVEIPPDLVPENTTKSQSEILPVYPLWNFTGFINRLCEIKKPVYGNVPLLMEDIGQGYGFIIYRTVIPTQYQNVSSTNLTIDMVADRTIIIVDGKVSSIHENGGRVEVNITLGKQLDIFVENQGRVCDASKGLHYLQQQAKGILGNVRVTNKGIPLKNWTMVSVNDTTFKSINDYIRTQKVRDSAREAATSETHTDENIRYSTREAATKDNIHDWIDGNYNVVHFTLFDVPYPMDSFVRLDDFDKGQVYINGINIGRFWQSQGPQKTLFVPKNCIQEGSNVIAIISLSNLKYKDRTIQFVKEPVFE